MRTEVSIFHLNLFSLLVTAAAGPQFLQQLISASRLAWREMPTSDQHGVAQIRKPLTTLTKINYESPERP